MRVKVTDREDSCLLELAEGPARYRIAVSEHGLRDIVFELERRRAGGRCCPETEGEHTCANAPGHAEPHLCRGCTRTWRTA